MKQVTFVTSLFLETRYNKYIEASQTGNKENKMIRFHTSHGTYNLKLRASFGKIRSERQFREMIENGIKRWEAKEPAVGKAFRAKWESGKEFDVLADFGIVTWKERVQ